MQQITDVQEIYPAVQAMRMAGEVVGVVPTMGALHDGHLSLVRAAQEQCDRVVVTIFLNPTQFAPHEDLNKYPQPLEEDLRKLSELDVDLVFCPRPAAIYPPGYSTYVLPPDVAQRWEGEARATHFRGVATVVLKLFHLVPAHQAYFGQKDYQQTLVVKKMVDDLNLPIQIVVCPIVREPDGLAMSSRNAYLSPEERTRATVLYRGLIEVTTALKQGVPRQTALEHGRHLIAAEVDQLEYLELVDADTLEPADQQQTNDEPVGNSTSGSEPGREVILVAARVGKTRLIDNWLID